LIDIIQEKLSAMTFNKS